MVTDHAAPVPAFGVLGRNPAGARGATLDLDRPLFLPLPVNVNVNVNDLLSPRKSPAASDEWQW